MSDDTGLIRVRGFAPAALVVEFNLNEWRRIGNDWSMADQHSSETDTQYHARLSAHCEPYRKGTLGAVTLWHRAMQWSDYFTRSNA